jgi:regulator of protease activity HflC (stomatin/prohibitin superfamily)
MEKQMNAERNKRAIILEAEGKRQADITLAEGNKQSTILNAEAERESSIRKAQGIRESRILEAEGNAEAIKKVAEAKAEEIKLVYGAIMSAKPDDKLVAIKSLEALKEVSNGTANKVFIPFDATKAMGALGAMTEVKEKKTK